MNTVAERTLVLIHGWGFSGTIWQPLQDVLPDGQVVSVELPGHGRCGGGGRLADPGETARALEAQLPSGIGEPVWVGWSLGGLAALALAARWRGRQRLVLVCATPRFTVTAGWPHALAAPALAAFAGELERDRQLLERRFAALCADAARAPAPLRRQLLAAMTDHPATLEGLRGGLQALAGYDLRAVWSDARLPVSAWLARDDPLVPAGVAQDLKALRPDARVRQEPGGHAAWLENPSSLAGFLLEVAA